MHHALYHSFQTLLFLVKYGGEQKAAHVLLLPAHYSLILALTPTLHELTKTTQIMCQLKLKRSNHSLTQILWLLRYFASNGFQGSKVLYTLPYSCYKTSHALILQGHTLISSKSDLKKHYSHFWVPLRASFFPWSSSNSFTNCASLRLKDQALSIFTHLEARKTTNPSSHFEVNTQI